MKMKNISPIDLQFFFTYFCYSVLSDLITNFKIWTNLIIMYIVHPLWRCNALGNWKYWVLHSDLCKWKMRNKNACSKSMVAWLPQKSTLFEFFFQSTDSIGATLMEKISKMLILAFANSPKLHFFFGFFCTLALNGYIADLKLVDCL